MQRETELGEDGLVTTHARQTETEGLFREDATDVSSYDTEGNITLSTTRDVYNGSAEGALFRDMADGQNAEDGAAARFATTGDRLASLLTMRPRPVGRGGLDDTLARRLQGGSADGVSFAPPPGMTNAQVAEIYAQVEGPEDLATLTSGLPAEQASALQANFAVEP